MPSRPVNDGLRKLTVRGTVGGKRIAINLTQRAGGRAAAGTFSVEGLEPIETIGALQTANGWASFTAIDRAGRALVVMVDEQDPTNRGSATIAINADGAPMLRGSLPAAAVSF